MVKTPLRRVKQETYDFTMLAIDQKLAYRSMLARRARETHRQRAE
jgi:hypothetical protein